MRYFSASSCSRLGVLVLTCLIGGTTAYAQSYTRMILSSGMGVPGRQGFIFGPFSSLAMNSSGQLVFLTRLRGSKADVRAVVRSAGVSFEVVAFEGLKLPGLSGGFVSFSAPSLNDSGQIAFTATLGGDTPASAVVRMVSERSEAVATTRSPVPGKPDSSFLEFSAPVITSAGNVAFGARFGGKQPGSGLFLWTPHGLMTAPLPPELALKPSEILVPAYARVDVAFFVPRGSPSDAVTEQIFRTIVARGSQDMQPGSNQHAFEEVLAARAGESPVKLVFVLAEGDRMQTAMLTGDPASAVKAQKTDRSPPVELDRIQAQTAGPRGNVIVAAGTQKSPNDLALYCYCENELVRLTSPEEFLPVTVPAAGRPLISMASDGQRTVSFIAPEAGSDATSIFVVSIPQ